MKVKVLLTLVICSILFSSCNFTYRKYPEDLALPIIKALQNDDKQAAYNLLLPKKELTDIINANPGLFGYTYYNKYQRSYGYKTLYAKIEAGFEASKFISKANSLDWGNVKIGTVQTEEVNQEDASYTKVTIPCKFGKDDYQVVYNAIKSLNSGWYLANDIYLAKKPQQ